MSEPGPPPKSYWFPAKTSGWGWGPPTGWQGWVVIIGYIALLSGGSVALRPDRHLGLYLGYTAALSILLIGVCYAKGERPSRS